MRVATVFQQNCFLLTSNCTTTTAMPARTGPTRRLGRLWSRSISCSREVSVPQVQSSNLEQSDKENIDVGKLSALKRKMELMGINCDHSCTPGLFNYMFCPKCKGGQSIERSLSVHISQNGDFAMWRCFRTSCGWAGRTYAESNNICKVNSPAQMTEESLRLEPLDSQLISYFGDRSISEKTLRRNAVMKKFGGQAVIAFTYRQNGVLVGCKYRSMGKRFWQEKGTERWLYGLDDIYEASEIIIVEGEIDKLSVEEAGFHNCVSVPAGAPEKVSARELPGLEKDTAFRYIWNSKEYLDKVSRIILATDGDGPGQALAEELARRLGKERCWQVNWPKKDALNCFKDSNEVLTCLGPAALQEVIENAELYQKRS